MGVTGRSGDPLLSQLHDEAQASRRAAGRARPVREPHARAGRDRGRPGHRRRRRLRRRRTRLRRCAALQAAPEHPWVSRGGVKLAAALDHFGFDPAGRVCLDVGASTGGFTEVLLARGARARLRGRCRARPASCAAARGSSASSRWKQTDIRALDPDALAELPDFATIDVSFISLKLVLPALDRLLRTARASDRADQAAIRGRAEACEEGHRARSGGPCGGVRGHRGVRALARMDVAGIIPSPIEGGEGNREFLLGARRYALTHHCGEWTSHKIVTFPHARA